MSDRLKTSPITRRRFLHESARVAGTVASIEALLAACSTSTTPAAKPGVTTVTVMYSPTEFTPAYVQEFEKLHPDIKIHFLNFDQSRLNAMLAAGQAPDFVEGSGVPLTPNLVVRGLATSLDPYIAQSKGLNKDTLLPINDVWRFDGKIQGQGPHYGIVKDWSLDGGIWYNKQLFDQQHIPYLSETEPVSFQELLNIAKRLTVRQQGKTTVYGIDALWNGDVVNGTIMQMIAQQGSSLFNDDLTKADYTTPEALKALQWYVDLVQAHVCYSPLDPNPADSPVPGFLGNRVAMVEAGYWFTGAVGTDTTGALANHVGFAPAPVMGSKRFSSSFGAVGAWIPNASKNKDAAWKVMEYFMANTPALDRAKSGWGFPSLQPLLTDVPQSKPYQAQSFQTQQNDAQHLGILHFSPYTTSAATFASINKYMQPVYRGQAKLIDAAKQLTDEVNTTLQQGKQQVS